MPRLRSGVSTCVAALLLAACTPPGYVESGSLARFRPLAALSADEMCPLVRKQTIETAFGVTVDEALGDELGRGALRGVVCRYRADTATPLRVLTSIDVSFHRDDPTALEEGFTDVAGKVVDYQPVADLGVMAGFGPDVAPGGRDGSVLAVVFSANRARLVLTVQATPGAELAQLEPIAAELLAGVNKELR